MILELGCGIDRKPTDYPSSQSLKQLKNDTHIGHRCDIWCLLSQGSEKKAFNIQAIKSKTDQRP